MINLSEKVANDYRKGTKSTANPNNIVTSRRRKLYSTIKERTGGDDKGELDYSLNIIQKERPKVESYIISQNEVPLNDIKQMTLQAYKLRCNEIESTAGLLGVSEKEAGIFLEDDEAETEGANNYESDNFLGELFAPIGVAAKHLSSESDSYVSTGLISGIVNTIGSKVDTATLKRAAQNKKGGVLGFLSGGSQEYEILREYLQRPENADEKAKIMAGVINDVGQLRGFLNKGTAGINVAADSVIDVIAKQKKKEAIKKALPLIIIGIVAIILITVLIVKRAKNK